MFPNSATHTFASRKLDLAMECAFERRNLGELAKVAVQCSQTGSKSLGERCAKLTEKLSAGASGKH